LIVNKAEDLSGLQVAASILEVMKDKAPIIRSKQNWNNFLILKEDYPLSLWLTQVPSNLLAANTANWKILSHFNLSD
jgi:hypothetical protein